MFRSSAPPPPPNKIKKRELHGNLVPLSPSFDCLEEMLFRTPSNCVGGVSRRKAGWDKQSCACGLIANLRDTGENINCKYQHLGYKPCPGSCWLQYSMTGEALICVSLSEIEVG
jgi:hypothetical protein